ncbi:Uncharacterised protein [Serratia fonticola]|uniref:Glyoxalase/fosfomycin resistance/dioxygenase domain-containing protein n=1 Tax=Serratia fonticola TaxID=47917 RepID=A0A4U9WJ82_SERFO|nr:Uncharacterised protein [Serratia fonticola]
MNITPCLSHVSLGTNNFDAAAQFYDQVLGALGCRRVLEHPGAIGYGRDYPEFWLQLPIDGKPAGIANGVHVGFFATSKQQVDEFYQQAGRRWGARRRCTGLTATLRCRLLRLFRPAIWMATR